MYSFLVLHADLQQKRGDLDVVKGHSIRGGPGSNGAAALMLVEAGIDLERDGVKIAPVPGAMGAGVNFGVTAAKALEERRSTASGRTAPPSGNCAASARWCSTCAAATRPKPCFNYTMASIATTRALARSPTPRRPRSALSPGPRGAQANVTLAAKVGQKLFPPPQAELIVELIRRDLPYYDPTISRDFVAGMNRFARDLGILQGDVPYEQIVAFGGKPPA